MTTFDLVAAPLSAALSERGYATLTPVQGAMLEEGARNADLLVSAQTGSGKTVAFGIALAPLLLEGQDRFDDAERPLALVVAPTRELAMQVRRELEWLYGKTGARFASCIGGMDYRREFRALEQGAHIVVGTPGRLRDHITRGSLDLSGLKAAVLDEADEMLDLGFREDLEFILDSAPEERRTLLFSATVPAAIEKLARSYQKDAVRVALAVKGEQHVDIAYHLMTVAAAERDHAVINTLLWFDSRSAIIFCQTREAVRHLAARLTNRGFAVVALSGELSQGERTNALQAMRDGRARICVATDVAARGIDLPNLDLVIHADLPTNPDTLLHRSGRTGRAGRKGVSVVIAPQHRRRSAERVLGLARVAAEHFAAPTAEAVEARQLDRLFADESLTLPAEEDERVLVDRLLGQHSAEQIAAAWLRAQRRAMPAPEEISAGYRPAPRATLGERPDVRFEHGGWFSLSIGRKQRAEPRWILPIICKAGDVTRKDVGSIRILEDETRFEIAGDAVEAFAAVLAKGKPLERGARIVRIKGDPESPAPAQKAFLRDKPRGDQEPKPRGKGEWRDKTAGDAPRPPKKGEWRDGDGGEARKPETKSWKKPSWSKDRAPAPEGEAVATAPQPERKGSKPHRKGPKPNRTFDDRKAGDFPERDGDMAARPKGKFAKGGGKGKPFKGESRTDFGGKGKPGASRDGKPGFGSKDRPAGKPGKPPKR